MVRPDRVRRIAVDGLASTPRSTTQERPVRLWPRPSPPLPSAVACAATAGPTLPRLEVPTPAVSPRQRLRGSYRISPAPPTSLPRRRQRPAAPTTISARSARVSKPPSQHSHEHPLPIRPFALPILPTQITTRPLQRSHATMPRVTDGPRVTDNAEGHCLTESTPTPSARQTKPHAHCHQGRQRACGNS